MIDYTGIQVDTNNSGTPFDWTSCTNDPWYYYRFSNQEQAQNHCGAVGDNRAADWRAPQAAPSEVNLDNELE